MKTTTSFFINLLAFSVFAIFFYIFFVIVWGDYKSPRLKDNLSYQKFASGHLTTRIRELDSINEVDVLFLGSSRSYRHYDTRKFSINGRIAFNLGSSSQTMLQTEYFINKYYSKLKPKIVVFDIYPGMFTGDGVESTLDVISNEKINWESTKFAIGHRNLKVINTLFYSYYREIFHNANGILEDKYKPETKDLYVKGGYVEREIYYAKKDSFAKSKIIFDQDQIQSFNKIISLLKKSDAKIFLVISPMHKSNFDSYTNFTVLDSLVLSHGLNLERYIGVDGLDEIKHFYDPYHLNQDGVEIFNNEFIKVHPEDFQFFIN